MLFRVCLKTEILLAHRLSKAVLDFLIVKEAFSLITLWLRLYAIYFVRKTDKVFLTYTTTYRTDQSSVEIDHINHSSSGIDKIVHLANNYILQKRKKPTEEVKLNLALSRYYRVNNEGVFF